MKIAGLQKVSTIDYVGKICLVVFLWGCNFRCGFCYNPDLVVRDNGEFFSKDYVLELLSKRRGKLDAVCITGGEPLMSLDFDFVRKIKEMGFSVKVDTNGSFPDRLKEMIDLGLVDYIAMDVKGAREDYVDIVGVEPDISKIEGSMRIVNDFSPRDDSGEPGGEFRITIVPGLHDSGRLVSMGRWMNEVCGKAPGKIFLQGFKVAKNGMIDLEFMKKKDVLEGDLLRMKKEIEGLFGEVEVRC